MSKAREIAEERLAKGEISEDEFKQLIRNLSSDDASKIETEKEPVKGSVMMGIFCLIGALGFYLFFENIATDIINDCVKEGRGSFKFCKENGLKWPIIYAGYGLSLLMILAAFANFLLPKK